MCEFPAPGAGNSHTERRKRPLVWVRHCGSALYWTNARISPILHGEFGWESDLLNKHHSTVVVLKRGREKPVRQRHPWLFSGAIAALPDPVAAPDGAIIDVVDADGAWLARGLLNRRSQIQVRLCTWQRDEAIDEAFWRGRIERAIAGRAGLERITDAMRLVHGENDGLPGLVVDRVGAWLVLQAGALGIDQRKAEIARLLLEITGARGVVERSDFALRKQEGLGEARGLLAGEAPGAPIEVREAGLRFDVDILGGQKTGFYTDQRENRRRASTWATGRRVLNAFAYTGAFAVHALRAGASRVTNLDSSVPALEQAENNLRLNGFDPELCTENIAGDAFQVLRDWRAEPSQRFGMVILDPPKFVSTQAQMERGLRGYKEINRLALHLLEPESILVTFSCSGLVSADLFQKVVFGAAIDAGRTLQIVDWLHQDRDHPVAITFPEGAYLKGLICRVL